MSPSLSRPLARALLGVVLVAGVSGGAAAVPRLAAGGGAGAGTGAAQVSSAGPMLAGRPGPALGESLGAGPRWRWPLAPVPVPVRTFRAPASDWGPGHRGLDLGARSGAAVLAVEDGLVVHAGVVAGRGTLTLRHHDGLVSTYEPVRSTAAVGDEVPVGARLGVIDGGTSAGHCGPRTCLHLGARRDGDYLDPWPLLVRGRLALLPLR